MKFPVDLTVFDVMVNDKDNTLVPWTYEDYVHSPGEPVNNLYVDVPETSRLTFLFNLLVKNHHGVMFIGNAGTGVGADGNGIATSDDGEREFVNRDLSERVTGSSRA